jgi:ribonuclease-3
MKKLDYIFKDEQLLDLALTQSGANAKNNNERLEFLGDRVLGLVIASMLYKTFPDETEGVLARRHAALVSTKTLGSIAKEFGFDKLVRHGHMTGGKMEHIAANTMESVIAAIYLDGGWDEASKFVLSEWTQLALAETTAPKDPKTELQELAQHYKNGELPKYEFLNNTKSIFNVRVDALGKTATGHGGTKKSATADAAKNLLNMLKE